MDMNIQTLLTTAFVLKSHVAKVEATASAHSMVDVTPFF